MESNELICLYTSVLIDFSKKKKDKTKLFFYELTLSYSLFVVSIIAEYEILIGNTTEANAH